MNEKTKKEIEDHLKGHAFFNEKRPYAHACQHCSRRFKHNLSLSAHIQKHSEQNGKYSINNKR